MKHFAKVESLSTLAGAREAYTELLAAYHELGGSNQQLKADFKAASELNDEHAAVVAQKDSEYQKITSELDQVRQELDASQKRVKELEGEGATQKETISRLKEEAKGAEAKAAEICASVGVDPLQIKPESEDKSQDLMEQFRAIKDPGQRMAFYREHKDQLLSRK